MAEVKKVGGRKSLLGWWEKVVVWFIMRYIQVILKIPFLSYRYVL